MTIRPSVINTFNEMFKYLKNIGLSQDDIITMIQRRTKPKVSRTDIVATLRAMREIEERLKKAKRI